MRHTFLFSLFLLLFGSLAGCPSAADDDDSAANDDDSVANDDDSAANDDDSAANDDDSASNDDDSAGDDDDATDPSLDPCAIALEDACADIVVDAPGADSEVPFRDPLRAANGVRGGGVGGGSLDVFSLDWTTGTTLTLRWSNRRVLNAVGPDFVVFENPFEYSGPDSVFMDLVVVELSIDGMTWVVFPHDYVSDDESTYSTDPADWPGFAGASPVLLHEEDNPVPPTDPQLAGGDAFDLDDLPAEGLAGTIREEGFLFIRLTAAPSLANPDTGEPYVADPVSNGADIDGVYARLLEIE